MCCAKNHDDIVLLSVVQIEEVSTHSILTKLCRKKIMLNFIVFSALSKLVFFQLSNHISFFFFVKKCRCNSAKPKTYLAIICFFYSFFSPQTELTKLIRFFVHFCFIKKFAQFSFNDGMQETLRCFP